MSCLFFLHSEGRRGEAERGDIKILPQTKTLVQDNFAFTAWSRQTYRRLLSYDFYSTYCKYL